MKSFREKASLIFFGFVALCVALVSYMGMASSRLGAPALSHTSSLAASNACLPGNATEIKKYNPNKMLFISCGGFLD